MSLEGAQGWFRRLHTDVDDNERRLDEQLDDSFPASDPPSHSPIRAARPGILLAAWRGMRKAVHVHHHP